MIRIQIKDKAKNPSCQTTGILCPFKTGIKRKKKNKSKKKTN